MRLYTVNDGFMVDCWPNFCLSWLISISFSIVLLIIFHRILIRGGFSSYICIRKKYKANF